MRNRPDSRGRLAGLTPVGSPWPRPGGGPGDEDDDRVEPPPARRRPPDPPGPDGWVPEVDLPPRRSASAVNAGPPQRAAPPPGRGERPDDLTEPPDEDIPPAAPDGHRATRVRYSPAHAWGRVAQRWVPEPLRDARVDPGRRGALLLTLVAAVAALVAAVGVWRDQPQARPVQAVSLVQVSEGAQMTGGTTGRTTPLRAATASPTATPAGGIVDGSASGTTVGPEVLVVSVTGAVRHPGLVRLPPGSRVADAIAEAGGVTAAADLTGVNLAARLADGASVVVSDRTTGGGGSSVSGLGSDGAAGAPTVPSTRPAGKVDLNTADAATLDALPGVGPVTAAAIVAWRNKNGRFASVEQLQEIQGIGPAKYAALAPLVTV